MRQVQRAFREMLLIGIAIAIAMGTWESDIFRQGAAVGVTSCLLFGLLLAPVVWGAYRLARFVIVPR